MASRLNRLRVATIPQPLRARNSSSAATKNEDATVFAPHDKTPKSATAAAVLVAFGLSALGSYAYKMRHTVHSDAAAGTKPYPPPAFFDENASLYSYNRRARTWKGGVVGDGYVSAPHLVSNMA
jgi:hypothetical protein